MSAKCEALLDTMAKALDDGKISEGAFRAFNKTFDPAKGNVVEAVASMRNATSRDNFNRARDIERANNILAGIDKGENVEGLTNLFVSSFDAVSETANIPTRANSIEGQLRRMTGETDEEFGTKVFDWFQRDPVANEEFAKSLEDLNYHSPEYPQLRKMADDYADALEEGARLANKEGMSIGDVRNKATGEGYLPHAHNASEMEAMGLDGWKTLVRNKIDYKRMGFSNNTSKEFEEMLDYVFETIRSKGLNKKDLTSLTDGKRGRGKRLVNQRMEERFLHFNKGEWINYAKEMNISGGGLKALGIKKQLPNVYSILRTHLRGLSNDIAVLQVLGSDPDKMFNDAMQHARDTGKFKNAWTSEGWIKGMFNIAMGRTDMNLASSKGTKALSYGLGSLRSLQSASSLAKAVVASLVDIVTTNTASVMAGMNPITTEVKTWMTLAERAIKGGKASNIEMQAIRLGIATDAYMSEIRNTRWAETGGGSPTMQKIAEQVLRVSGLIAWTNVRRTVWKVEFAGTLGDNMGKNLDSFRAGRRIMRQYGLKNEDWLSLGDAHKTSPKDGGYIDTTKIYETNPDLAMKIQDIMEMEANYAVVMPDARTRVMTTGGGKAKGTVTGEVARNLTQFKGFPISLMMMQTARFTQIESVGGKVAYVGSQFIGMSMMAMGVLQIKEMLLGREPREMNQDFIIDAIKQGGTFGVFADVALSENQYGQDDVDSFFLGAGVKPIKDAIKIKDAMIYDDKEFLATMVNVGLGYVPAKNLFYTEFIYKRYIANRLKELVDPKYQAKMRRQKSRMKKDFNQGFIVDPL